jgi:hypothetical protein
MDAARRRRSDIQRLGHHDVWGLWMSNGVRWTLFSGVLILALAVFISTRSVREDAGGSARQDARSQPEASTSTSPILETAPLPRQPVAQAPLEPQLPWSANELGRDGKDRFGRPTGVRPFLHHVLNDAEFGRASATAKTTDPKLLDWILRDLPTKEDRSRAQEIAKELYALIAEHDSSLRVILDEIERQNALALHQAVERGDYILVEHAPGDSDKIKMPRIQSAVGKLMEGRQPIDVSYTVASSRTRPGEDPNGSAIIYLTRETFPKLWEAKEENWRVRADAERLIRTRLGIPVRTQ